MTITVNRETDVTHVFDNDTAHDIVYVFYLEANSRQAMSISHDAFHATACTCQLCAKSDSSLSATTKSYSRYSFSFPTILAGATYTSTFDCLNITFLHTNILCLCLIPGDLVTDDEYTVIQGVALSTYYDIYAFLYRSKSFYQSSYTAYEVKDEKDNCTYGEECRYTQQNSYFHLTEVSYVRHAFLIT